nr:hypothetical protein [Actinomycetota bacterium]
MSDIMGDIGAGIGGSVGGGVFGDAGLQAMSSGSVTGVLNGILGGLKLIEMEMPLNIVTFDYNPNSFTVSRQAMTRQAGHASPSTGGSRQSEGKTYATTVKFTALLTEEQTGNFAEDAATAVANAALGFGVLNRANTLLNWTSNGPGSLLAQAVTGLFNIRRTSRPTLILQWGDPARGFLMFGLLKTATINYKRFDGLGNPIRAEATCEFVEKKNEFLTALTNPTSGGVAGRRGHTMTQGETLMGV